MNPPVSHWLGWTALLLEPAGVFLLSVEAIKLRNLRQLNERLQRFHLFVNPEIKFVDSEEEAKKSPPHALYGSSAFSLWTIFVVIFIATPLVLLLTPCIIVLSKIEEHTETGAIGV